MQNLLTLRYTFPFMVLEKKNSFLNESEASLLQATNIVKFKNAFFKRIMFHLKLSRRYILKNNLPQC